MDKNTKEIHLKYIFVYGSLKKHFYNEDYLLFENFISECTTIKERTLVKTNKDPFPFLLKEESKLCKSLKKMNITGELYRIKKDTIKKIDKLESYPILYSKSIIEVELKNHKKYNAIVYELNKEDILKKKKIESINKWTQEDEYDILYNNLLKSLSNLIK